MDERAQKDLLLRKKSYLDRMDIMTSDAYSLTDENGMIYYSIKLSLCTNSSLEFIRNVELSMSQDGEILLNGKIISTQLFDTYVDQTLDLYNKLYYKSSENNAKIIIQCAEILASSNDQDDIFNDNETIEIVNTSISSISNSLKALLRRGMNLALLENEIKRQLQLKDTSSNLYDLYESINILSDEELQAYDKDLVDLVDCIISVKNVVKERLKEEKEW